MRDLLLVTHIAAAVAALLAAIGQVIVGSQLRKAGSAATVVRHSRFLVWLTVTLTVVILVLAGAGFALLGRLWTPADPWVAASLAQAFAVVLAAVGVIVPAAQRIRDLAAEDLAKSVEAARDPVLVAVQATLPAVIVEIAVLMTNKPPVLAIAELVGLVVLYGLAVWGVTVGRRSRPALSAGRRALVAVAAGVVVVAVAAGYAGWRTSVSRLPESVSMTPDGGAHHHGMGAGRSVDLTTLAERSTGAPVQRFIVTAQPERVTQGGRTLTTWRFKTDGGGSDLRVTQGSEVVVRLVNRLPVGTSIHWHGVDVPNSQDGVAGVTQDAVPSGGTHTYRFLADRAGSYWYHSHQNSAHQVRSGLFGALIVTPPGKQADAVDHAVVVHTWESGRTTLGESPVTAAPGQTVRLRVVNTDSDPRRFTLTGAPFRVAAMDGTEVAGATPLSATAVSVPAGGRYDLTFTQPATGTVWLRSLDGAGRPVLAVGNGSGTPPKIGRLTDFDLTRYGTHARTELTASTRYTREYTVDLDGRFGWYDGRFGYFYTMNGVLFPNGPMLSVRQGDLVRVKVVNRTGAHHPMHLHGHHFTVLDKDGKRLTGAPVVLDTLDLAPHETWTMAFKADNLGLWMYHCHNLVHARDGMDLMVMYERVTTPYRIGRGNRSE
jgi:FtsP/CotA-like multicopper oxidase with cupredoxin domain